MDTEKTNRIGEYLVVEKLQKPKSQKTDEWMVLNDSGYYLGEVSWYSPWRQYCFKPIEDADAIFNSQCLLDIATFLQAETEKRKTHWMKRKGEKARRPTPSSPRTRP